MYDIFLSYSTADRERVRPLYDALKQQGWTVFWDHASIQMGAKWQKIITEELNACGCVMVVWTQNSLKSDYVLDESRHAKQREVLLPLSFDDTKPPLGFGGVQTLDITDWDNKTDHPKFAAISRPLLDKMRQATQKRLVEFKQRETELIQTQNQLNQQRDELAQGAEDFATKLAAAEQRAKALDAQLTAARDQARLAEQRAAAAEKSLAIANTSNQSAQQQLAQQQSEAQVQQIKLTRQQIELKQKQERIEHMEQALHAAELAQQSCVAQFKQKISAQQLELARLHKRAPEEVENIVVKEVRSPKDKLIGVVFGGVLVAAAWGVMGNHSAPADNTPAPPIASAPVAPVVEPAKPVPELAQPVEDQESKRLAAIKKEKAAAQAQKLAAERAIPPVADKTPATPIVSAPVASAVEPAKPVANQELKRLTAIREAKKKLAAEEEKRRKEDEVFREQLQ
ncbi:MAG: TIR domain-containing protein [Gallionella sp.]